MSSVPSVLQRRQVSPARPGSGNHKEPRGETSLLTQPLQLHPCLWPHPPIETPQDPPTLSDGRPMGLGVHSGFVPPFPTPSLDRSSLSPVPSAPALLPGSCPQPREEGDCLHTDGQHPRWPPTLYPGIPHPALRRPHRSPVHVMPPSGPTLGLPTWPLACCVAQACAPTSRLLPARRARAVTATWTACPCPTFRHQSPRARRGGAGVGGAHAGISTRVGRGRHQSSPNT